MTSPPTVEAQILLASDGGQAAPQIASVLRTDENQVPGGHRWHLAFTG